MLQFLKSILLQIDSTTIAKSAMQDFVINLSNNYGSIVFSIFLLLTAYGIKMWMVTDKSTLTKERMSVDIPIDLSLLLMAAYVSEDQSKTGGQMYVLVVLGGLIFLLVLMIFARCLYIRDIEKDEKDQSKWKQISWVISCYLLLFSILFLTIKL